MSRYTGPRLKVMRALGVDLPGLSRKSIADRPYPPGQHGQRQQRKSGFGLQLQEKQKLRFNYGLSERQMRRLVLDARRDKGSTGAKLGELLERRLDNAVFRAGFASSGTWAPPPVGTPTMSNRSLTATVGPSPVSPSSGGSNTCTNAFRRGS